MILRKQRKLFVVKFVPDGSNPDESRDLEQIRKIIPRGRWSHSRVFEEVDIAIEKLQITPLEFWLLDRDTQALVIAHNRVRRTIEAYEEFLARPKKKAK